MSNEIYLYLERISLADVLGIKIKEAREKKRTIKYIILYVKKKDIFLAFI